MRASGYKPALLASPEVFNAPLVSIERSIGDLSSVYYG